MQSRGLVNSGQPKNESAKQLWAAEGNRGVTEPSCHWLWLRTQPREQCTTKGRWLVENWLRQFLWCWQPVEFLTYRVAVGKVWKIGMILHHGVGERRGAYTLLASFIHPAVLVPICLQSFRTYPGSGRGWPGISSMGHLEQQYLRAALSVTVATGRMWL